MKYSSNLREDELKKDENTILGSFDFSSIEELDPSLAEGHRLVYDREVPFELRLEDTNGPQEVASFEAIRLKFLLSVMTQTLLKLESS